MSPGEAAQGGVADLTFRVPNESDASTVVVEILVPVQTLIPSAAIRPLPGWTVRVERMALATPVTVDGAQVAEAVTKLTWTAAGTASGIGPGEYQKFGGLDGRRPADYTSPLSSESDWDPLRFPTSCDSGTPWNQVAQGTD